MIIILFNIHQICIKLQPLRPPLSWSPWIRHSRWQELSKPNVSGILLEHCNIVNDVLFLFCYRQQKKTGSKYTYKNQVCQGTHYFRWLALQQYLKTLGSKTTNSIFPKPLPQRRLLALSLPICKTLVGESWNYNELPIQFQSNLNFYSA